MIFRAWGKESVRTHVPAVCLYTVLVFLLLRPALGGGLWWGHDSVHAAVRVHHLIAAWKASGPFYTPWLPDICFGYGWPFFTFYSPLGYYVAAAGHFLFGFGIGSATVFSFLLAFYLSGISMYALAWTWGRREAWPRPQWWAVALATLYVFSPYHITDAFTRGNLAETWAWATLPLLFLGWRVCQEKLMPGVLTTALGMALLMLSHNVTALYAVMLAAVFACLMFRSLRGFLGFAAGGFLGCMLSAFYWYPAMKHLRHVTARSVEVLWGAPEIITRHAVHWPQFLTQTLGTEGSIEGPNDEFGINLGPVAVLAAVLALAAALAPGTARRRRYETFVLLSLLAIFLFIMSPQMPWVYAPAVFRYIQFSWRLLLPATFLACITLFPCVEKVNSWVHPLILAGLAALLLVPVFPKAALQLGAGALSDEKILKWYAGEEKKGRHVGGYSQEYRPRWVPASFTDFDYLSRNMPPENRLTVREGEMRVTHYRKEYLEYSWRCVAAAKSKASVHVFYFPGWRVYLDGESAQQCLSRDENGLVKLKLPAGKHEVRLVYRRSGPASQGFFATLLGWFLWFMLAFWFLLRRKRERKTRQKDYSIT